MKILVAAKHVIDHNIQVRVRPDNSGVYTENIKMSLNPFDETAIEAAICLKEQGIASEILVLSIGPEQATNSLRAALALGVDRATLVKYEEIIEPLHVAEIFAKIAQKENIDLILLGKQSIDGESNQVGQMLSYKLGWSLANSASNIEINKNENSAKIAQEMDNGTQTIEISLPCVITCDLQLAEPRFPNMMNIMQAKRKNIEILDIEELDINLTPSFEITKIEAPKARGKGAEILPDTESLLNILKNKDLI